MKDNTRRLLLTGDDFGRSASVNAAIEQWHRAGALTQASLMVNEPGAEEAVAIARRNPDLRVGLHLTLCDGCASDGRMMQRSPALSGLKFAFFPGARSWLRKEIAAQFAKFRALGFAPAYWDGHTHLHLHPTVLALTLPVAAEHGFKFTRLVREPGGRKRASGILRTIFLLLGARAAKKLNAAGIEFADVVFGLSRSGKMDLDEVRLAAEYARSRLTEVYFHPGAESVLKDPAGIAKVVAQMR